MLAMSDEQKNILLTSMEMFNDTCNSISERYPDVTSKEVLHKLCYKKTRSLSPDVPAQFVCQAQRRVAAANKTRKSQLKSKKVRRRKKASLHKPASFRKHAAIQYDGCTLDISGMFTAPTFEPSSRYGTEKLHEISLATYRIRKREKVGVLLDDNAVRSLARGKLCSSALLEYRERSGEFYMIFSVDIVEPEPDKNGGVLGIDLGVVNIAVLSDGTTYTSERLETMRRKRLRVRRELQARSTPSSRKRLKKIGFREARFRRDENHCISKQIVQRAKDTGCAIALEDLSGINASTTVAKSYRARRFGWSFAQLGQFIEYKARLAGVGVIYVNPAYTSQTCPRCGHTSKKNRPTRDEFKCCKCGCHGEADHIAAMNVSACGMLLIREPETATKRGHYWVPVNVPAVQRRRLDKKTVPSREGTEIVRSVPGSCNHKPATSVVGN